MRFSLSKKPIAKYNMTSNMSSTKPGFQRIVLIGRQGNQQVGKTLAVLIGYLSALDIDLVLETETAKLLPNKTKLTTVARKALSEHCDLLIVVGGDGSLLNAAHTATEQKIPVLGINRGQLGFLADIHPDQFSQIHAVIQGEYQKEERFLITATVSHHDKTIAQDIALNDIVLLRGDIVRIANFDIYIDGQFVCNQRADGLIVATPTGSTAYALSGGGPILHPKLNALVIVPMFSHTLTTRPLVSEGDSVIDVLISENSTTSLGISYDGGQRIPIPVGSKISIQKHPDKLQLVHPTHYNYFDTLRNKLHWERKPRA